MTVVAIAILMAAVGWLAVDVGKIERRKRKERWKMPDIEDPERLR